MPLYLTRYDLPTRRPAYTQCWARDREHLDETMSARGMGESFSGVGVQAPEMPSALLRKGDLAAGLHALIWVSMIAIKAGSSEAWELLNDDGLIHETAHQVHAREISPRSVDEDRVTRLAQKIEELERLVPGVHPSWAGENEDAVSVFELAYERDLQRARYLELQKMMETVERLRREGVYEMILKQANMVVQREFPPLPVRSGLDYFRATAPIKLPLDLDFGERSPNAKSAPAGRRGRKSFVD